MKNIPVIPLLLVGVWAALLVAGHYKHSKEREVYTAMSFACGFVTGQHAAIRYASLPIQPMPLPADCTSIATIAAKHGFGVP